MIRKTLLVLLLLLAPEWGESIKCFLCSQKGQKLYRCPTDSDSRTTFQALQNQYIDTGKDSTTGCSLQIGFNDEVVYQGTMSAKDCKEKKSEYLRLTKNFTCCFGCDGCNWDLNTAFSSDCAGKPEKKTTNNNNNNNNGGKTSENSSVGSTSGSTSGPLVNEAGLDYKLASLILLISTVILSLVLIVICCIYFVCSDSSVPRSPASYPSGSNNNISPSDRSLYPHKNNSFE